MALIGEKIESRRVNTNPENGSVELLYWVDGVLSESAAIAMAESFAPGAYGLLQRTHLTVQQSGPLTYDVTAHYSKVKPKEPGDSEYSFDVSTVSQHITQSRDTVARYGADGWDVVDFDGAIGVNPDGSISGTDILLPQFEYVETHWIDQISAPYIGTLHSLCGSVNDGQFKHFRAGEALFLGASAQRTGIDNPWRVTFRFRGEPNLDNARVPGIVGGIDKDGWDYLWVYYQDAVKDDLKLQVPKQANVERVYRRADFALLGLGT